MNTLEKLKWLIQAGVTDSIGDSPVNRLTVASSQVTPPTSCSKAARAPLDAPVDTALAHAIQQAESAKTLEELYRARSLFEDCPLKKTAAHTLHGRGTLPAHVLCIGDVPDSIDDKQDQIFAGESGKLLDKMLSALGLSLDQNTYATLLIPWRPPGNRQPTDLETALCLPFLKREIALIRPQYILLFGALPARVLLQIGSLPKARSAWHDYQGIPTLATFSPTTLLKKPEYRRPTWEDLKRLKERLETRQTP